MTTHAPARSRTAAARADRVAVPADGRIGDEPHGPTAEDVPGWMRRLDTAQRIG
ncbi:ABC transporter ATP-binding protein [Kitasatospora sp. NPDC001664]